MDIYSTMIPRKWLCIFFVILRHAAGQTTPRLSRAQIENISTFVDRVMSCRRIPGMNLAVVNKDQVLITKGFGFANKETRSRVTADTLFPIASTTKAFTVTLLAMILQREASKNFTWETPIKDMIGENFQLFDAYATEKSTLRDILSHRTGVPDYFLGFMAGFPESETISSLVKRLRYHRPESEFRTQLLYNNYMYGVAGHISELLKDGTKWEQLLRTHLLEPLGMDSTITNDAVLDWSAIALPYVLHNGNLHQVDKELVKQTHPAGPAGSIISTARDMAKWLQFHLNEGAIDGEQLLPKQNLAETYRENMPSPAPLNKRDVTKPTYPVTDVSTAYDMGWQTSYYRGFKRIWHSGSIATYKSQVWFYPELNFGLYCTCNGPPNGGSSWALRLILQHISDVLMGENPWITADGACIFPAPYVQDSEQDSSKAAPSLPQDTPSQSLNRYIGTYNHPGFGDIQVTLQGAPREQLHLSMGRFLRAQLFYNSSQDTFYTNLTGVYWYMNDRIPVRFQSSSGNEVDILKMPMHSPFTTSTPFAFMRGNAQSERLHQGNRRSCTSTSVSPHSVGSDFVWLLVLVIVVLCEM